MATAFQSNAFQNNAFQIDAGGNQDADGAATLEVVVSGVGSSLADGAASGVLDLVVSGIGSSQADSAGAAVLDLIVSGVGASDGQEVFADAAGVAEFSFGVLAAGSFDAPSIIGLIRGTTPAKRADTTIIGIDRRGPRLASLLKASAVGDGAGSSSVIPPKRSSTIAARSGAATTVG